MNKIIILIIFNLALSFGQNKLSLEDAINMALTKNFDIQIAKNNREINELTYQSKYDDYIPDFSTSITMNHSKTNQNIYDNSGLIKLGNIDTTRTYYSSNIGINLRIGDLLQSVFSFLKAKNTNERQLYQTKTQIQRVIVNVITAYFNLAKQQNLLEVQDRSVETAKQQLQRANSRYEIGSIAKKDVYSAKVQLNNSETALLRQKLNLKTALNNLNILLGRDAFEDLIIDKTVVIEKKYSNFDDLKNQLVKNNPEMLSTEFAEIESDYDLLAADYSLITPVLGLNLGYNKNSNSDPTLNKTVDNTFKSGFSNNFQSSINLSLSYSLSYSNFLRQEQAELANQNAIINTIKKGKELNASLYQAYISYENALELIKVQELNVEASREDLRLAQERFNLGSGTSLELQSAQDGLVRAESELIGSRFDAKLAELEIERLLGLIQSI